MTYTFLAFCIHSFFSTGLALAADAGGGRSMNSNVSALTPKGVREFTRRYPQTHFRYAAGDILSSGVLGMTGLFGFASGSDPFAFALDRNSTLERHTGVLAFIAASTVAEGTIDKLEQKSHKKIKAKKTRTMIRRLKQITGSHVIAGSYAYAMVAALLEGQSIEEVMKMLGQKETFAAAASMRLGFYASGKVVDKTKDAWLLAQATKNPQAMRVMSEMGMKSGLATYAKLLSNADEINDFRKSLQKSKVTLGLMQPETIPALAAATVVEWTSYYVLAKVWDSMIHETAMGWLQSYDEACAINNSRNLFNGAVNQQELFYDETLVSAAEDIRKNFGALAQLYYSSHVDQQFELALKTDTIDYIFSLYEKLLDIEEKDDQIKFLASLLDPLHERKELNEKFIQILGNSIPEFDFNKTATLTKSILEVETPEKFPIRKSLSGLDMASVHRMANKFKINELTKKRDSLLAPLLNAQELMGMDDMILDLYKEQQRWSEDISKISGMNMEQMENSYNKYNLDPNKDLVDQNLNPDVEIPDPETIFDIILVQNLYMNHLKGLAFSDHFKKKIDETLGHADTTLFLQVKALESVLP